MSPTVEPGRVWHSASADSLLTQKKICTMPTATGRIVAIDTALKIRTQERTQTIQAKSSTALLCSVDML